MQNDWILLNLNIGLPPGTDMVGGVPQYATTDSTTETLKTQIHVSHVWFYGINKFDNW